MKIRQKMHGEPYEDSDLCQQSHITSCLRCCNILTTWICSFMGSARRVFHRDFDLVGVVFMASINRRRPFRTHEWEGAASQLKYLEKQTYSGSTLKR